jgi:hypothetical protein
MSDNMPIRQFIEELNAGHFEDNAVNIQIYAGWYGWFCRDTSLVGKTRALGRKLKQLAGSAKINADTMYVFFKNNCPMNGNLYDEFRICDMETGNVIYTVTPSCGHTSNKGKAEVWGRENCFKEPLVSGTWKDVKTFFGVK